MCDTITLALDAEQLAANHRLMRAKLAAHFQQVNSTVPSNTLSTTATEWHTQPTSYAALNDWLFDQGSLTQRLTQRCRTEFRVEVLVEGWQTLTENECQALKIAHHSRGWVREVLLCDGQHPWVFARSVAAQAELAASGFDISQLGTRSLGELLFSHQAFSRGSMYIAQIPCSQLPANVQQLTAEHTYLWARRSCFQKNALGVLVAEVFLPQLWQDTHNLNFNTE